MIDPETGLHTDKAHIALHKITESVTLFFELEPTLQHVHVDVDFCDDPAQGAEHDHVDVQTMHKDYYRKELIEHESAGRRQN